MRTTTASLLLLRTGCAVPAAVATRGGGGGGGGGGGPGNASPTASAVGTVEALPAEIGDFRRASPVVDYERAAPGAGLGASVRYEPTSGERMRATVYIYDRGRARQPEGAASPDVAREINNAFNEVAEAVDAGLYRAVTPGTGMTVGQLSDPGSIRCGTFRTVQQDGSPTADAACVAVNRGRFVKVRITAWQRTDPVAVGVVAAMLLSQVERAQQAGGGAPPATASRP